MLDNHLAELAAFAVEFFQAAGGKGLTGIGFEFQAHSPLPPLGGFVFLDFVFQNQQDQADGNEDTAKDGGAGEKESTDGAAYGRIDEKEGRDSGGEEAGGGEEDSGRPFTEGVDDQQGGHEHAAGFDDHQREIDVAVHKEGNTDQAGECDDRRGKPDGDIGLLQAPCERYGGCPEGEQEIDPNNGLAGMLRDTEIENDVNQDGEYEGDDKQDPNAANHEGER